MPALLTIAACNPGAFDDFVGHAVAPTLDAATDATVDARIMDAESPRDDAAIEGGRDAVVDASEATHDAALDASADAALDAGADASAADASLADAGRPCFPGGSSLISYFPFEGSALDAKGSAAVVAAGAEYGAGHAGSALTAGEVALNQVRLDAPSALTISAWLRLDTPPPDRNAAWLWKGDQSGLDWSTGYWLVIAGTMFRAENATYLVGTPAQGHLGFALTDGSSEQFVLTDQPLPRQRYVLIVASFDGARMRLYLDGSLVRDEVQRVVPRATVTPLQLASPLGGSVAPLLGELDEVAFFDRALSPSEVRLLYQRDGLVCAD